MANEAQLRASEIRDVLLQEIDRYESDLKVEEVGEILEVKDGVARIYGLTEAMASEMLEITSTETGETITALALNLEEDVAVAAGYRRRFHRLRPLPCCPCG